MKDFAKDFAAPRPFLCPEGAADGPWTRSPDNVWWRPGSPLYPATNLLLPGDVLLFAPRKPDATQRAIRAMQQKWGAAEQHARFTHAALYIGLDHLLCEAVPVWGVTYSPLWPRLGSYCWLIRRWPELKAEQRHRIALTAAGLLGNPYGWKPAMLEALKHGWGAKWDRKAARGLVCSRLCDRAITIALLEAGWPADELRFHSDPQVWVTPAVLSASPLLTDVETGWRTVEP